MTRTRIRRHYAITTGVWLYYVDEWREAQSSSRWEMNLPEGFYPCEWIKGTPDLEHAKRMARDISLGLLADQLIVVCEFSNGTEFQPVK